MTTIRVRTAWLLLAMVIVVAAVVMSVTTLTRIADDKHYGPLEAGGASLTDGAGVIRRGEFGAQTLLLGSGPAYSYSELVDTGTHDVTVTAVEYDDVVRDARWAPLPYGPEEVFRPPRWLPFPATVPADRSVQVRLTVRKPTSCGGRTASPDGGRGFSGDYRVRWRSLLSDHVTAIDAMTDDVLLLC